MAAPALVTIVFLASVGLALKVFDGDDIGPAYPTFLGVCERLRDSGLPVTPDDVWCYSFTWTQTAAPYAAAAVAFAGYSLAGVILAATGRRLTALLPLIVTAVHKDALYPDGINLRDVSLVGTVVFAIALAVPAVLVMLMIRGRSRNRLAIRPGPAVVAAGACAVATGAFMWLIRSDPFEWLPLIGDLDYYFDDLYGIVVFLAVFAALLGTDRQFWPWSAVLVVFLVGGGPSLALESISYVEFEGIVNTSAFSIVPALAGVALVWSAWQPLSRYIDKRGSKTGEVSGPPRSRPHAGRRLRPTVVLNAFAAGLIVVSGIASANDTLAVAISTPYPTYRGLRDSFVDTRARIDLRTALHAMDSYFVRHGTYRGFDQSVGARTEADLDWLDGPLPAEEEGLRFRTILILRNSDSAARVATLNRDGFATCMQRGRNLPVTFGEDASLDGESALESAVANCESRLWTREVAEWPEFPECPRDAGRLICRMVEVLAFGIRHDPHGYSSIPTAAPPPGFAEARHLEDAYPIFLITHKDGTVDALSGISTSPSRGIGSLVSWCPGSRTFEDPRHGSVYDEYGFPLVGYASRPLGRFEVIPVADSEGWVQIGSAVPAPSNPPRAYKGNLASPCKRVEIYRYGMPFASKPPRYGLIEETGQWFEFRGRLVVPLRGPVVVLPAGGRTYGPEPGESYTRRVQVEGVDRALTHDGRYARTGIWLARAGTRTLSNLVYLGPIEKLENDHPSGV
ncbi:MAG: hypothetical protein WD276_10285 [Actinomycetota bacterium]